MTYRFSHRTYDMRDGSWNGISKRYMERLFGEKFMDNRFHGLDEVNKAIARLNNDGWSASIRAFDSWPDKEDDTVAYAVGTPDDRRLTLDLERCGQICDYTVGDNEPTWAPRPKEDETLGRLDNIEGNMVSVEDIRSIIRAEIAKHDMNKKAEEILRSILEDINKPKENKMEAPKQTLRQKLRYAALPKDEKILRESGFYDSTGALTEQGRRIVVDMLWDTLGADDRKKVVEAVEATLPKE